MERVRLVDWLKSERDQHVGGGLYYNSQILFAYCVLSNFCGPFRRFF